MTKNKTTKTLWIAKTDDGYLVPYSIGCNRSTVMKRATEATATMWSFLKKQGWKIVKVKLVEI